MLTFLGVVVVLIVFLASTYGWGRFVFTHIYQSHPSSPAFCVALGLSAWIAIGGFLNLAGIAYGFSLEMILAIGLVLSGLYLKRNPSNFVDRLRSDFRSFAGIDETSSTMARLLNTIPIAVVVGGTVFYMATVLPSGAFNFHDDFHKYFVAPYRMLHTGSLGGTEFEYLGLLYLGAQGYLQAFILSRFPLGYVNGFDLIFCFLVAGLLLNDIGLKVKAHWSFRTLAVTTFVVLHPQYVNISALYSGILFIFGMVYGTILSLDALRAGVTRSAIIGGLPLAAFFCNLVALKGNFIPYGGAFMAAYFAVCGFLMGKWPATLRAAGVFVLTAVVIFAPWMAVSSNNLVTAVSGELGRIGKTASVLDTATLADGRWRHLFSPVELTYGGSYLEYQLAVAAILLGAVIATANFMASSRKPEGGHTIVFGIAALAGLLTYAYLIQRSGIMYVSLRYSVPMVIAALSPAFLALDARLLSWKPDWAGTMRRILTVSGIGLVLFQGVVVLSFADTFIRFRERAIEKNNVLAFNNDANYRKGNQASLGPSMRAYVRYVQSKSREGANIFAWIATPFHLDFARNTILPVEAPELVLKGLPRDDEPDHEDLRRSLQSRGIDYVMWQYKGYGVRTVERLAQRVRASGRRAAAQTEYKLVALVAELVKSSEVLYADPIMVITDISKPRRAPAEPSE